MSTTKRNENLQPLNQISSFVSERDMKIWENVAYSDCIQKQTEKIKNENIRLKTTIHEKQKECKTLDDHVVQLDRSNLTQQESLKIAEESVIMHQVLKENLLQEANNFTKSYATTLEMYNDELKEYRTIFQNASQSYKDLKVQQIEMQKLEVKKMLLEAKFANLENSRRQFNTIQNQIFHNTIVHFAEFYVMYHKNQALKQQAYETKKLEQQLLKEHLHLTEAVKEKKKSYEMKLKMNSKSALKDTRIDTPVGKLTQESNVTDKLQKFLNEETLTCSLTSLAPQTVNFNEDKSKVKILDVKIMQPPPLRAVSTTKHNPELRKKMQDYMSMVKKETKRTISLDRPSVSFQPSQNLQQIHITPPASQQSQSQNRSEKSKILQHNSQTKISSQGSERISQNKPSSQGLQKKNLSQGSNPSSQKHDQFISSGTSATKHAVDLGAAPSILKPTNAEKVEIQDNVSKFFNSKKKVVSFKNVMKEESPRSEVKKFSLFSMEDRHVSSGRAVENFSTPFSFSSKINPNNPMDNEPSTEISDETRDTGDGSGNTFTMPTFPTTGGDLDQMNELEFNGLDHNFQEQSINLTDNFAVPAESTTFNFFGSTGASSMFCFP